MMDAKERKATVRHVREGKEQHHRYEELRTIAQVAGKQNRGIQRSRTFFDESVQVFALVQNVRIRYKTTVRHDFVDFRTKTLRNVAATTELPEHVRKGRGRSINASDPAERISSGSGVSNSAYSLTGGPSLR